MQITSILTLLLSASLTTAFYIPPRPLAPRLVDTHRGLHSRQVVRDVDPVAPFLNADSSSIPGPVYGFPGDLVDPNTQAPALAPVPEAPEQPPVYAPISGPQNLADTIVPVSNEPDSALESVEPEPEPESQPAPVEQAPAPAPVEAAPSAIEGAPEAQVQTPAPTPVADLPRAGTDSNGNVFHVDYEHETRWSTEVVYVTAST